MDRTDRNAIRVAGARAAIPIRLRIARGRQVPHTNLSWRRFHFQELCFIHAQRFQRVGNGEIDLTARANLQIRGVTEVTLPGLQDAMAEAGLLDGRRATTHWNWCQTLIKRAPRACVDADPIFVRDENVYTSAGVTAGMDLALALVEEDHGSRLALQVARNLVLYLRRPGSQSQFSAALSLQLTDRKPLRELEAWVLDNLQKPLTVPLLAQRVAMSPRNFARVFAKEMNTTPAKFVERLRVEAARRRLEESHNNMEMIAGECGFGNVNSMRNVFQRTLKIAPGQYRRHFRHVRHHLPQKI